MTYYDVGMVWSGVEEWDLYRSSDKKEFQKRSTSFGWVRVSLSIRPSEPRGVHVCHVPVYD